MERASRTPKEGTPMSEDAIRVKTQSGEATIDIAEIVAVVKCNGHFLRDDSVSYTHLTLPTILLV